MFLKKKQLIYIMKIVELHRENINQILALDTNHTPKRPQYSRYSKKDIQYLFDNPDKCKCFGIFDKKKLIGYSGYRADWSSYGSSKEGKYEICALVVHKKYRKKGLGKKLFLYTIQQLKRNVHPKEIYLSVSQYNLSALTLYLKNGFIIFDFKKKIFDNLDRLYLKLE